MSRTTSNHVTVIRCDSPRCPVVERARFMTASIATMARIQAHGAGWERLPPWAVEADDSPRRRYDVCPAEAGAALERVKRRPEILADERYARSLQRGWERQAECLRRVERRIAKLAREAGKLEARDRRARRKAERAAERERRKAERAAIVPRIVPVEPFATPAHRDAVRIIREAEPQTACEHTVEVHWAGIARCSTCGVELTREQVAAILGDRGEGEFADDGSWRSAEDPAVIEEIEHARDPDSRVAGSDRTSEAAPREPFAVAPDGEPGPRIVEPAKAPRPRAQDRPRVARAKAGPTVLDVIERILRARGASMTVAEIVEHAVGDLALPTASKTPKTIVSRDLALDIKADEAGSRFVRTAPGTFMLREKP